MVVVLVVSIVRKVAQSECDCSLTEKNKTGTSKVGAISKAQNAQNIFTWKKKLEIFEKIFSFGKCRTVPKNVKGDPF